ncbi:MAG: hypothetical protein H7Z21_04645 [Hymenobacter sp.]|nr:hypothetical protein [Hymenobacter sp.]
MKKPVPLVLLALVLLSSCSSQKIATQTTTYKSFHSFQPIDPTEYQDKIAILDERNEIIFKDVRKLNKSEVLGFLVNETVLVSVGEFEGEGEMKFGPAGFTVSGRSYKVTMDYMKFATLAEERKQTVNRGGQVLSPSLILGYKRVGVGLRIIAYVTALESGINLGDLFALGIAARERKVSGTLILEVIGIKSGDVTASLPLPSEINQTTIQGAMQAMATIKSKIYEEKTGLYPQVMAVKVMADANKEVEKQDLQQLKEQVQHYQQQQVPPPKPVTTQ